MFQRHTENILEERNGGGEAAPQRALQDFPFYNKMLFIQSTESSPQPCTGEYTPFGFAWFRAGVLNLSNA